MTMKEGYIYSTVIIAQDNKSCNLEKYLGYRLRTRRVTLASSSKAKIRRDPSRVRPPPYRAVIDERITG